MSRYLDLHADDVRPLKVRLDDGRWVNGWLEAQRKVCGAWAGWVRYTTGPAETRVDWFFEDRVRRVTDDLATA
jgi:hypothetical protein